MEIVLIISIMLNIIILAAFLQIRKEYHILAYSLQETQELLNEILEKNNSFKDLLQDFENILKSTQIKD